MRIPGIFGGLFLMMFLAVPPASSQQPPATGSAHTPDVNGGRSADLAKALELVVPTAGYAYAGDWTRGLLPNVVFLGGTYLFIYEIADDAVLAPFGKEPKCEWGCMIGFAAMVVGKVWAVRGAADAAREFNEKVGATENQLTIMPAPFGGVTIGVRLWR